MLPFLAAAHAASRARQSVKLGVYAQIEVNFSAVMERMRSIRSQFNHAIVVINTSTSSNLPNFPGLTRTPYLTNRNFFDLQQLSPDYS